MCVNPNVFLWLAALVTLLNFWCVNSMFAREYSDVRNAILFGCSVGRSKSYREWGKGVQDSSETAVVEA
jgi:hypothetical protein